MTNINLLLSPYVHYPHVVMLVGYVMTMMIGSGLRITTTQTVSNNQQIRDSWSNNNFQFTREQALFEDFMRRTVSPNAVINSDIEELHGFRAIIFKNNNDVSITLSDADKKLIQYQHTLFNNETFHVMLTFLDKFLSTKIRNEYENLFIDFKAVCRKSNSVCVSPKQVYKFLKHYIFHNYCITFPIFSLHQMNISQYIYLNNLIGGVTVDPSTNCVISFEAIHLQLPMVGTPSLERHSVAFENLFVERSKEWLKNSSNSKLQLLQIHAQSGFEALAVSNESLKVLILIAISVMVLFAAFSTAALNNNPIQGSIEKSDKILTFFAGVVAIILSSSSYFYSVGILKYFDVFPNPVCDLVQFLIIGVGIDDYFILSNSWLKSAKLAKTDRIAITSRLCLFSIAITSLTNSGTFAIGMFNGMTMISSFSTYAFLTFIIALVMQALFIFPLIICCTYGTMRYWKNNVLRRSGKFSSNKLKGKLTRSYQQVSQWARHQPKLGLKFEGKIDKYLEFSLGIFVSSLFVGYLIISILGLSGTGPDYSEEIIFPESHPVTQFLKAHRKFYNSHTIEVLVNTISFPFNSSERDAIKEIHHQFANAAFTNKNSSLALGMELYSEYLDQNRHLQFNSEKKIWSRMFRDWLTRSSNQHFKQFYDFQYHCCSNNISKQNYILGSTRFQIVTIETDTFEQLKSTVYAARQLAGSFTRNNVSIFHPKALTIDGEMDAYHSTFSTLSSAIGVLFLVVCIFSVMKHGILSFKHLQIPLVVVSATSTLLGVIGFGNWAGFKPNSLSAINYLLAAGLSIDYSIHIIEHYFTLTGTDSKYNKSRRFMAIPISQSATTTLISGLFLIETKSYFFKSLSAVLISVAFIGWVHALVFIPYALFAFEICFQKWKKKTTL